MIKTVLFAFLFAVFGFAIIGLYSLLTSHLFIQSRVLQNPLGKVPKFSISTPPSNSLRGKITTLSGSVLWQSRTATEPAALTTPRALQQGENLSTGNNGKVTAVFTNLGEISLLPNSEIDVIQSLPNGFLLSQPTGSVSYSKTGTSTISVRSMSFLIQIESGNVSVAADPDYGNITVTTTDGAQAKVAYNNLDYVTQIVTVPPQSTMIFDDATRTFVSE